MERKARLTLLVAALAIGLGFLAWQQYARMQDRIRRAMTDAPCPVEVFSQRCTYVADNARLAESRAKPRAVLIGDSLTEYWKEYDRDLFGDEVVNRGISSQTAPQILLRFRQDVVALKPRVVHILAGTNDIAGNTGPSSPDFVMDDLTSMADLADTNGIKVVLGTIPPKDDSHLPGGISSEPWISIINRRIGKLADERGYVVADYHAALAGPDGGWHEPVFADFVHPNARGYGIMGKVLREALREAEGDTTGTAEYVSGAISRR
ncbi:MAG: GDSL family lipase [Novosphingobium sp.]|nr:GDSL family lipase [Novosphingobium sp.]